MSCIKLIKHFLDHFIRPPLDHIMTSTKVQQAPPVPAPAPAPAPAPTHVQSISDNTQTIYYNEMDQATPRMVTVVYKYNQSNGDLEYGAVIYRKDKDEHMCFTRKGHRSTALHRLHKYPVKTRVSQTDVGNFQEFKQKLRKQLFRTGVQNKPERKKN